jgi:ABC-type cobalamin/Fe3+-siderophores transport system ATPase subunit
MISKTQKVLLLDEPMKFVSEGLKPKVYEIMKRLSDDLGIQIIAVTHDPLMIDIADKVYVVKKEKGISVATVRG